jgi:hypothetical protein
MQRRIVRVHHLGGPVLSLALTACGPRATPLADMGPVEAWFSFSRGLPLPDEASLLLSTRQGCPRFRGEATFDGEPFPSATEGGPARRFTLIDGVEKFCELPLFLYEAPGALPDGPLEVVVRDESATWRLADPDGLTTGFTPVGAEDGVVARRETLTFAWTGPGVPSHVVVDLHADGEYVTFETLDGDVATFTVEVPDDVREELRVDLEISVGFVPATCEGFASCEVGASVVEEHRFTIE